MNPIQCVWSNSDLRGLVLSHNTFNAKVEKCKNIYKPWNSSDLGYQYKEKHIYTKIRTQSSHNNDNMLSKGAFHIKTHYPSQNYHHIPKGYKRWTVCDDSFVINEMPIIVSQDSSKKGKKKTLNSKVLCLSWWDAEFGIHPDNLDDEMELHSSNPYAHYAKRFITDVYNMFQYTKQGRKIPEYLWREWDKRKKTTYNPYARESELQYMQLDKYNVAIYDIQYFVKHAFKTLFKECDFEPLNPKDALLYDALDELDELL